MKVSDLHTNRNGPSVLFDFDQNDEVFLSELVEHVLSDRFDITPSDIDSVVAWRPFHEAETAVPTGCGIEGAEVAVADAMRTITRVGE